MLMTRPGRAAYTCSFNTHEAEARSPDKLGTKGNPASTKRRQENGCKNCVLIPALLGQIARWEEAGFCFPWRWHRAFWSYFLLPSAWQGNKENNVHDAEEEIKTSRMRIHHEVKL